MKIFNTKYIAILLVFTSLLSCSTSDIANENENLEQSNLSAKYLGIAKIIVDGKESVDRIYIEKQYKNAWNVHYDYPNEKMVISTNPTEFEKYQSSNADLKVNIIKSKSDVVTSGFFQKIAVDLGEFNANFAGINGLGTVLDQQKNRDFSKSVSLAFRSSVGNTGWVILTRFINDTSIARAGIRCDGATNTISDNDYNIRTALSNIHNGSLAGYVKNDAVDTNAIYFYESLSYGGRSITVSPGKDKFSILAVNFLSPIGGVCRSIIVNALD